LEAVEAIEGKDAFFVEYHLGIAYSEVGRFDEAAVCF